MMSFPGVYIPTYTESYWQIGFNDGYSGKEMTLPVRSAPIYLRPNQGYINGWNVGREKRRSES